VPSPFNQSPPSHAGATRAADVSPPWCGKSPRRRWFRLFDRLTPEHVGKPHCHDGSFPTAGSGQPLLVHGAGRLKNNDIRGTQTHVHKSGGRQPAVGRQMRIGRHERYSWADPRRCACVCVDARCNCAYRRHGGLTPPALVLQCERLPAKQRFLQCTNAR
jgi:hypothetical protein